MKEQILTDNNAEGETTMEPMVNPNPQLVERAMEIGGRIFDQQREEGYGDMELRDRLWEASHGELRDYSREIWEGYVRRSGEVISSADLNR